MSGFNPYGNPQYPPPQSQIYPQLYNPSNAPPPGQQQGQPGYAGGNPQFPYQQPGFPNAFPYPGQPQPGHPQPGHPASMSYPNVTPSAPAPAGFGYPNVTPTGYPTGFPHVTPTHVVSVEWIPSSPQSAMALSDRAVVAGYEGYDGSPLWVIRSRFEGDLIPGKLAVKHHSAYVPWGGNENAVHNFEVCCARPESVRWVESRDGAVPPNAVAGGQTSSGETLFIGRAKIQGALTPGKVQPSHKVAYVSFAGKEHPHKTYEVLCTV